MAMLIASLGAVEAQDGSILPKHITEHPLNITVLGADAKSTLNYDEEGLPPTIILKKKITQVNKGLRYTYTLTALADISFSISKQWSMGVADPDLAQFYAPGFWYKRNTRSPEKAPSFKKAKYWSFREDRLSAPVVVGFNPEKGDWFSVSRMDVLNNDPRPSTLEGKTVTATDIGSLGFGEHTGQSIQLRGAYPFVEAPYSYQSKLDLKPAWQAFFPLSKGASVTVVWELSYGKATDFTDLVNQQWNKAFDRFDPQPIPTVKTDAEIKAILSNYFYGSYAETKDLKGFSGLWFNTETCETTGVLSVGFCGKVLANSYNLLEYGYKTQNEAHIALAKKVLASYYTNGFTENGLIRELVFGSNAETVFSLRKQSEGIKNLLFLLDYGQQSGSPRPDIEVKVEKLLLNLVDMQQADGSFPRKFDQDFDTTDPSKGSTQSIITPMVMASRFFKNPRFLKVAQKAGVYTKKNIIDKADYFSSTLDADCEDKEAAAIAAASFYHLALASESDMYDHYVALAGKAAVFGLSWYYLYDVPFDKESLLYKAGLKTRGWGNVSTENNHIDVWAFDFPHVLIWLAKEQGNTRFSQMATVIETSIKDQMLPYKGHMVGVGKVGYMPEIIQHTTWDYGANGKGFLNAHMSVGWTVASIWEVLTPGRFQRFMERHP
ncbi:hypothetical protein [Sediminicola luteus]|nr:hypothetical protein [Sediminicola luteus]